MTILKAIGLVGGISLLYYGLGFLGAAFTGAGHGSYFFAAMITAPLSAFDFMGPVWFVFWPSVALLLALRQYARCRNAAIAALVAHYVGVVIVCFQFGWSDIRRSWHSVPGSVLLFMLLYLASQAFMWFLLTQKSSADPCAAPNDGPVEPLANSSVSDEPPSVS
jgi:hypothetical protein